MGRKKNGKKVGKISKIFLLLQKRKEGEEEKASSLLSFEFEYTLTRSLAHYYAFLGTRAVLFFADTRRPPTLTCRERERKKKDG